MKKNLVIGVSAVVFAISSAFTTAKFSSMEPTVIVQETASSDPVCYNTGGECDGTGPNTCRVHVQTVYAGWVVVTPLKPGCAIPLSANSPHDAVIYFPNSVYRVFPNGWPN